MPDRRSISNTAVALLASLVAVGAQAPTPAGGQGPLTIHQAAQAGDAARVAALLDAAPGLVADKDERGRTPLHLAARNGHGAVAGLLLESGAPLDVRDGSEDSPLHSAARAEKWAVVDRLVTGITVDRAAALNVRDFDGGTVLHLASRSGRTETVGLLVSKGADLNLRNTIGQTAYNVAEEAGFKQTAALLAQKGADGSPTQFPRLAGPYLGQAPPGLTPQIFAKGIVSTRQGVYGTIVFSPGHRDAFWRPESPQMLFMEMVSGAWTPPRAFPFDPRRSINVPFLSPDGRRLYFMSGTKNPAGMDEHEAIWYVERTPSGWSEPSVFDAAVNSVPMHWQFSMDQQGSVYLSAGGGIGGIACARFEEGRYRTPEKLPAPVNLPHTPEERFRAGEVGPFISPKGDYLIFTKFGNGLGLWISFRHVDGSWGEPMNLSEKLGGTGNDSAAQVTPDGKYLFFQSVRPGSAPGRSFYWVDARVIELLRPSIGTASARGSRPRAVP